MKIVFMGNPSFACPSLELLNNSEHEVVGVISDPPKSKNRKKIKTLSPLGQKADELDLNLFTPQDLTSSSVIEWVKDLNPDIFIIVAFKILPKKLIDIPRLGAINLHASLLPKYRGASPIQYALMNMEKITGNTTFFIIPQVDKGNIILQSEIEINDQDNYQSLSKKLSNNGAQLIIKSLHEINLNGFKPFIQDETKASYAPKIKSETCRIDWNEKASIVHSKIRALYNAPGAYTNFNGKRIKIHKSKIHLDQVSAYPGSFTIKNDSLFVSCSDFQLEILFLQPEGKRTMSASEWTRGINKIPLTLFS